MILNGANCQAAFSVPMLVVINYCLCILSEFEKEGQLNWLQNMALKFIVLSKKLNPLSELNQAQMFSCPHWKDRLIDKRFFTICHKQTHTHAHAHAQICGNCWPSYVPVQCQSWALEIFLNFSIIKNDFFASFIKLITYFGTSPI